MEEAAPTYDVFLVLHPFREVVPELKILMRPVMHLEAHHLVGAEGYYAAATDAALINLRFHRDRADRIGHGSVVAMLGELGLPAFAPEELSDEEKHSFFLDHLAAYSTYVQHYAVHEADGPPLFDRVIDSLAEHTIPGEPTAGVFDLFGGQAPLDDFDVVDLEADEPPLRGVSGFGD
jgi:hypothetical protein